jgi:hypothetical protein
MASYDSDVTDTRKALGEDAFAAAWAEGATRSPSTPPWRTPDSQDAAAWWLARADESQRKG